ncbi:UNVERIFIED_CONTAM: hypothetical protein RMT77_005540 [Armadillidium vulgare]
MSSKSKEGTKAETSDYVDALSEALMRIFYHSNNSIFVSKCFSYLKVNTPSHARKEIQKHFQKVIGFVHGPKEPEANLQRSVPNSKTCHINAFESFDDTEIHSAFASNTVFHPVNDTFEDPRFYHEPEQHIQQHQDAFDVDQFSSESLVDLANESLNSMYLTSTPYEKEICPPFDANLPFTSVVDVDSGEELEVLRYANHDDENCDIDVEGVNEEIESSYGSINFSLPEITEPTASEYSINFSHPEYLNESYLLRDLNDLLERSDEAVDVNFTHNQPDITELTNKEISSQELIDKALSSINARLLADIQDNSQSSMIIAPESQESFKDYTEHVRDISSLHNQPEITELTNKEISPQELIDKALSSINARLLANVQNNSQSSMIITPESQESFKDYTEHVRDISSLHNNYVLHESEKSSESRSVRNFEADEEDCIIIYDASESQAVTEASLINNNSRNNVDLIDICEFSNDSIDSEKSTDNNNFDSNTERLLTEEKSKSSSESLEKSYENVYDADDMETQYECYFDSNGGVIFEENLDKKSTEEEDTDDNDDESMSSQKEELIVSKTNSDCDHDIDVMDNNSFCRAVTVNKTLVNCEGISECKV